MGASSTLTAAASLTKKFSTELMQERRNQVSDSKLPLSRRRCHVLGTSGAVCHFSYNDSELTQRMNTSTGQRISSCTTLKKLSGSFSQRRNSSSKLPASVHAHFSHKSCAAVTHFDLAHHEPLSSASFIRDVNIRVWIQEIREMFRSMGDGKCSLSPYDTAWVSLIPAVNGAGGPQFPGSVQWIVDNQLQDGSWGDPDFFSYSNNVLNTLMCIIALRTWNTGSGAIERGVSFIRENLERLENEENEILCGFELVFPLIVDDARKLGLDIQDDLPVIHTYRAQREKKLRKLPLELVHSAPTSILYSLEGIRDVVNWDLILQFQQDDGSFLTSPASTACAYLHTRNEKCLQYLTSMTQKLNHAATPQYPLDIFEHCWVVDRLERLGIARYFEQEIKACLDHVYNSYRSSSRGISWATTCNLPDLDDSAMAFRLLRLYGYDVSPDCFKLFRDADGDWYTMPGELNQGVTSTFNFHRAAEVRFPEESTLREAAEWTVKFLSERCSKDELHDKWMISRDIAGEIRFSLESPWIYTPPRLEHRSYIDHYGPDDIWISKVLYRMLNVHNNLLLNLARADFNLCQEAHHEELQTLLRWHETAGLGFISSTRMESIIYSFYMAVCSLPAPELSMARQIWAQQSVMTTCLDEFFDTFSESETDKLQILSAIKSWDPKMMDGSSNDAKLLFQTVYNTTNSQANQGSFLQGRDISYHLHNVWIKLLEAKLKETQWALKNFQPSLDEYMGVAELSSAAEAVTIAQFFLGEKISHKMFESSIRKKLQHLVCSVKRLCTDVQTYQEEVLENKPTYISILQRNGCTQEEAMTGIREVLNGHMEELVKEVHQPDKFQPVIPRCVRQLYFNVARSFLHKYQTDDCPRSTKSDIEKSISRILYEPVVL